MRIIQFGTWTLPLWNKRDDLSPGSGAGALLELPGGGAWDGYGTGEAPEPANVVSTQFEIVETTAALVQTERDLIRARRGLRRRLWAETPSGAQRFAWARLSGISMERDRRHQFYQPVKLDFEISNPGWAGGQHGEPWYFDDGYTFDTGSFFDLDDVWTPGGSGYQYIIENRGNTTQDEITLTITAGATSISNIRIRCGDCDWTYGGTVAAGDSLVVNTATMTITNDGDDAYNDLTLNAGHIIAPWLVFETGEQLVTINFSGNAGYDADIVFDFYDLWE